jgi:phosphoribosyl 1,2-cyclic phosphodiesterase
MESKMGYKRRCSMRCADRGVIVDRFVQHPKRLPCFYFLTHMHSDHMMGLNPRRPPANIRALCGSAETLSLFAAKNPGWKRFNIPFVVIQPNQWMRIEDLYVLATDAHHIPGSLMYAFRFADGFTACFTGDFRLHKREHRKWARAVGRCDWLGIDASRSEVLDLPPLHASAAALRRVVNTQQQRVYVTGKQQGCEELLKATHLPITVADDFPNAAWVRAWLGKQAQPHAKLVLCHRYPDPRTNCVIQPSMQWHVCLQSNKQWARQQNGRWRMLYSSHAGGLEMKTLLSWLRPLSTETCHDSIGKSACR